MGRNHAKLEAFKLASEKVAIKRMYKDPVFAPLKMVVFQGAVEIMASS